MLIVSLGPKFNKYLRESGSASLFSGLANFSDKTKYQGHLKYDH